MGVCFHNYGLQSRLVGGVSWTVNRLFGPSAKRDERVNCVLTGDTVRGMSRLLGNAMNALVFALA